MMHVYLWEREKIGLLENCESPEDLIQNFSVAISLILTGHPLAV